MINVVNNEHAGHRPEGLLTMSLAESTRKDLRTEQRRLASEIDSLKARIEELKGSHDAIARVLAPTTEGIAGNGFAKLGLRDAIRTVLGETGALKPTKVTRILKSRGYPDQSKTPLGTRVSSDLWRMAKHGQVTKSDQGEYCLPEDA